MINRTNQYVPRIGLGTYNMSPEEAEKMTYESIMYGYRHIDTAAVYKNEEAVGIGLKKAMTELNLNREDIFVTTKLWPGGLIKVDRVKNYEGSIKSFEKTLLLIVVISEPINHFFSFPIPIPKFILLGITKSVL